MAHVTSPCLLDRKSTNTTLIMASEILAHLAFLAVHAYIFGVLALGAITAAFQASFVLLEIPFGTLGHALSVEEAQTNGTGAAVSGFFASACGTLLVTGPAYVAFVLVVAIGTSVSTLVAEQSLVRVARETFGCLWAKTCTAFRITWLA